MSDSTAPVDAGEEHRIVCHLDRLLAQRKMTLTELAQRVGVTVVNLSILKNDRAKAVRFSTLTRICDALDCQPGDLFSSAPAASTPSRMRDPLQSASALGAHRTDERRASSSSPA